jgi:hypothetical protein
MRNWCTYNNTSFTNVQLEKFRANLKIVVFLFSKLVLDFHYDENKRGIALA